METPQMEKRSSFLIAGLLFLGVASRLIPHPWNVSPVTAIALFGGAHLGKRWSLILPLVCVGVTDVFLGWHATVPFTWLAFLLVGLLGWWVRDHFSVSRIALAAVLGACLFFVISNFGVWLIGGLYPRTAAGLSECFVAAIPFFRGTLLGDIAYTAILFSLGQLVLAASRGLEPVPVKTSS